MKKGIAFLLAAIMVFALCACGKTSTAELKYATGGTSGTYYGFSGVIANVLNEKLKDTLNLKVESTGASKANIQMLASGDADIAIVQNDVMYYAYTGTDLFAGGDPITGFSAVCSCYPEYVQILAKKDITLEIKEYTDYVQPNNVVDSGELDANYFQHLPYLEDFNKENGTKIASIATIHVEPLGLYGGKQTNLDALK